MPTPLCTQYRMRSATMLYTIARVPVLCADAAGSTLHVAVLVSTSPRIRTRCPPPLIVLCCSSHSCVQSGCRAGAQASYVLSLSVLLQVLHDENCRFSTFDASIFLSPSSVSASFAAFSMPI